MMIAAAGNGWLDGEKAMMESLLAFSAQERPALYLLCAACSEAPGAAADRLIHAADLPSTRIQG